MKILYWNSDSKFPTHTIFLFISFLMSCNKMESTITVSSIDNCIANNITTTEYKTLFTYCSYNPDTIITNTSYTYHQALDLLKHLFDSVDNLTVNVASKTYLKHVYIADLTANISSTLLLGSTFGFSPCKSSVFDWNEMPLEVCYDYANSNNCTIWCGDRASFYKRLADSLLNASVEIISIKNIHTYPVVSIKGKRYIIDPFDIFIAIDTISDIVLDYQTLKNKTYKSICIKDVKHVFGSPTTLVSKTLWQNVQVSNGSNERSICESINSYLHTKSATMLKEVDLPGEIVLLQQHAEIQPTKNPNYHFAIKSKSKIGSIKYNIPNFYRQYFGKINS